MAVRECSFRTERKPKEREGREGARRGGEGEGGRGEGKGVRVGRPMLMPHTMTRGSRGSGKGSSSLTRRALCRAVRSLTTWRHPWMRRRGSEGMHSKRVSPALRTPLPVAGTLYAASPRMPATARSWLALNTVADWMLASPDIARPG